MLTYQSIDELVQKAISQGRPIGQIVLDDQIRQGKQPAEKILEKMSNQLQVMKQAADAGLKSEQPSASGLSGGSAARMRQSVEAGQTVAGPVFNKILARALAIPEVNARMGRIVAAPTAGSCGIIPAVLLTIAEERHIDEGQVVLGLFTAAGFGLVVANRASISGAKGGCQAECGSAAAMAAAAAVEILGGSPAQAADAFAIALKNLLGLACDPVAGLVEIPCIKRNAAAAAVALAAVEMALAGIKSAIPADEVVDAMKAIGDIMPVSLKETATGGLSATPAGMKAAEKLAGQAKL